MPPKNPNITSNPENPKRFSPISEIFTGAKKYASKVRNTITVYKSKKALLSKITDQDLNNEDKNFILSLPDDDLIKLCNKFAEIADLYRKDAGWARCTHIKEQAIPEIEENIIVIKRINSLLKYISEKRNIEVKYTSTEDLIPKD